MKIRLTCPKCQTPKMLTIRALHVGLKIRTHCVCGQAISARPSGKAAKSGELMGRLREVFATVDRIAAAENVDAPRPAL